MLMELAEIIRKVGVDGAKYIEEHIDPQYRALLCLHKHIKNDEQFVGLVVANALVSYQLSGKGEDWWWEFARWFSQRTVNDIAKAYAEFLPKSRNNRRLVQMKVQRLQRANALLNGADWDRYYERMAELRNDLAETLRTNRNAKTVVFAVKMFGYAMRIVTGEFRPYPMEIPIPADSRIKRLTERLGGREPTSFWDEVARKTGVPPLHIDSILWPAMGGSAEVRNKIVERFGETGKELIGILSP